MRKIIPWIVLVLLAAIALFWWITRPLPVLTVTTWPGFYGRAQETALMRPYANSHRVDVHIALYDGGLTGLRRAVASRAYGGDVIDFELPDAIEACDAGLLEPIDQGKLPPGADGAAAGRDFVPGALGRCWVGNVVYSRLIAYAPGAGPAPRSVADFFDLAKFPGRRALARGSAKYNLELALLADGAKPGEVYALLATDAGVARALHKLDSIRNAILWYDGTDEAPALVESGQARFALLPNNAIYDAATHHKRLTALWDGQLYEFDVFGVPKGDPRRDRAMDFIRFATGSAPLAAMAGWVPYGPARRSSLALVGKNPDLGIAMRPFLPTEPAHFRTAFAVDDAWWQAHDTAIEMRWQDWLAGR
jgi:putative spermidine/putrescine transport system substrate-binding protein